MNAGFNLERGVNLLGGGIVDSCADRLAGKSCSRAHDLDSRGGHFGDGGSVIAGLEADNGGVVFFDRLFCERIAIRPYTVGGFGHGIIGWI